MNRIRIIIMLLVLLMLNGCGSGANVPFSESKAPPDTAAVTEEKDPGTVTDVFSQIVIRESAEDTDMKEPEAKPDETADLPDSKQPDDENTGSPVISSSQPVSDQSGEAISEDSAPEEETTGYPAVQDTKTEPETVTESESEATQESETETESNQPVDPPPEESEEEPDPEPETESESEPITEPEPAFDIEYWISYARDTAAGLGLEFDSSAVDCWDNPITANPDCIYLERDITARLSRYAGDEDITAVWIWYENIGTNRYLIYIGYAIKTEYDY